MPRGDGTGPTGLGSMTGRGMRYCAGAGFPGYVRGGRGFFGFGRGFGMGRGFFRAVPPAYGFFPAAPVSPEQERTALENQVAALEWNLAELKKRLSEIA